MNVSIAAAAAADATATAAAAHVAKDHKLHPSQHLPSTHYATQRMMGAGFHRLQIGLYQNNPTYKATFSLLCLMFNV